MIISLIRIYVCSLNNDSPILGVILLLYLDVFVN